MAAGDARSFSDGQRRLTQGLSNKNKQVENKHKLNLPSLGGLDEVCLNRSPAACSSLPIKSPDLLAGFRRVRRLSKGHYRYNS